MEFRTAPNAEPTFQRDGVAEFGVVPESKARRFWSGQFGEGANDRDVDGSAFQTEIERRWFASVQMRGEERTNRS